MVYWGVTFLRILSQLLELYSWIDSICCMYLIDKFSQLLRCEVLLNFTNTWDIKYLPLEATSTTCLRVDFHCRVIFTCVRAWNLRSQIQQSRNVWKVARKRKSSNSINFTFNLNTLYLDSILFTWLKFTCVNLRGQKRVSGNALERYVCVTDG